MKTNSQIGNISLNKLNNAEHGNFNDAILLALRECGAAKIYCLAEEVAYKVAIDAETAAIKKQLATPKTDALHVLDKQRNKSFTYIKLCIETAEYSLEVEENNAAIQLRPVISPYIPIIRHPLGQKSKEIKGLLHDLSAPSLATHIETLRLEKTIENLRIINEEFVQLSYERSVEHEESKVTTIYDREATDNAYNAIVLKANAVVVLKPNDNAIAFVKHATAIINTTRADYNRRMAQIKSETKKEDE